MITKLTKYQESQIPVFLEKWINMPTVPIDHNKTEAVIEKLYTMINRKKPIIIYAESPIQACLMNGILNLKSQLMDQLRGQLSDQLWEQLRGQLGDQLMDQLRGQLSDQLMDQLRGQLSDQLWGQLGDQLRVQLKGQLWGQLGDQLWEQLLGKFNKHLRGQLWEQLRGQLGDQLMNQLIDQLWGQLKGQLKGQLRHQLMDQLRGQIVQLLDQLRDQLSDQLSDQLMDQLRGQIDQLSDQLRDQLSCKLINKLNNKLGNQTANQLGYHVWDQLMIELKGQLSDYLKKINNNWLFLLGWSEVYCCILSFGDFIGAKLDKEKLNLFKDFAENIHFIIPYEGIVFLSEKPLEIHWKNKLLHNDGGPSVKYKDGYSMFSLNGVKVPEYLAVTKDTDLDIEFFKKEKNADVRAEFIRKYGIERMRSLGKVIDSYTNYTQEWWTKSKYELIDMSPIFKTISYAPHLSMINQTTGIYHLEPVSPECKNLVDAFEKTRWNGRKMSDYTTKEIR